jgi:hypothetical protein
MRKTVLLELVFLSTVGLAACSHLAGKRELRPRPRLFVGHYAADNVWAPEWGHAKDIWESCPEAAFVWDRDAADYQLTIHWSDGRWSAQLFRSDFAYLLEEDSPDFNRIVRDSCKALRYDSMEWRAPLKADKVGKEGPADRYDLRELRNGTVSTAAIIDKKTGRVWIWTNIIDNNGKKTGKSAFLSEEVIPEPEK